MTEEKATQRRISPLATSAGVIILIVIALALIVLPARLGNSSASKPVSTRPELASVDPAILMPSLADLPSGTSVQSNAYVTTMQASQRNQTSLRLLQRSGREIGFERDFRVPHVGEIDVEVVRFKSHQGMGSAYKYFLTLPVQQGLSAVQFDGLGEQAASVNSTEASFVEFMRGRYYTVVTTIPSTRSTRQYIHSLAHKLDSKILHPDPSV